MESVGTASDKAYIGADKARDAALRHAGVTAADAAKLEVELSCEKGVMVYEVEFEAGGYEYDVDVNAKTGDILKSEKERDDDEPTADPVPPPAPRPPIPAPSRPPSSGRPRPRISR